MLASLVLRLLAKQGKKQVLSTIANKVLSSNLTNSAATMPKLKLVKNVFQIVEKRNLPHLQR